MNWLRIALIVLLPALVTPLAIAAQITEPVRIDTGLVTGITDDGIDKFMGIPYATPPVGALRWRAPQPAASWSGIRSADRYGDMCVQPTQPTSTSTAETPETMSEDCLTLNVFKPKDVSGPLPVMVWIHGGGFTRGASSVPSYDGTAFARGDMVFVSINYRLGQLGVFAHPALTAENADNGYLGNYGLMDQTKHCGLRW